MAEDNSKNLKIAGRVAARSAILLSFIVALEFVIMISPFAFFFYAVFNPFLLALDQSPLTRWLTAFFLPHMIVPPNQALTVVRILGSAFLVGGMAVFVLCALQIYVGRFFRSGAATKGFYALIRHPLYVALAFAALGLAILWPRFLTLALFAVVLFLYYLLAKDEERRMLARYGDGYGAYLERTGMFLPKFVERLLCKGEKPTRPLSFIRGAAIFLGTLVAVIGGGFILRAYTVRHLPLAQVDGVDVISITREDLDSARGLLPAVLEDSAIAPQLRAAHGGGARVLAYFIPVDYVMQGMIADTGEEWKLFEQHKTIGMIAEHIFHPFAHLTGGHVHPCGAMPSHDPSMHSSPAMQRRAIFIEVSAHGNDLTSPLDDFNINTQRKPLFFVDVHLHTGEILQVRDMPAGSGWGTVPTPMF